jgi:hypothetical protein
MPRTHSTPNSKAIAPSKNNLLPAPQQKNPIPMTPVQYPQMSFGQSMKDGFGLGVGSAIAQRMVGAFFPTNRTAVVPEPSRMKQEACETQRTAFENCLLNESEYFCHEQQAILTQCLRTHATPSETK